MVKVTKDKLQNISNNVIELVVKKNHDYGDAWQRFGIFTPLIRINDKILRVKTLQGKEALVAEEAIADTLKDIIGYAMLALLYLEEEDGKRPIEQFDFFGCIDGQCGYNSCDSVCDNCAR
jgi:hypothetical protein